MPKSKKTANGSGGDKGRGSNKKNSGEGKTSNKRSISKKAPNPSGKKKKKFKETTLIPTRGKTAGKDGQGYFSVHNKEQLMMEKDILVLADTVYNNSACPAHLQGKLFHYNVRSYDSLTKLFTLTYLDKYIGPEGVDFEADSLGAKDTLEDIKTKTVEDGMEMYFQAVGRMNENIVQKKALAQAKLKKNQEDIDSYSGKVDVSDLEKAALDDPRGWTGESVVLCDFVLTGVTK